MHPLIPAQLDALLTLQLAVAWAGEAGLDRPRMGWWSTQLDEPFAGHDLFERLLPRTRLWAALVGARAAARHVEARRRADAIAGDTHIATLFWLGGDVDEQLDDRLRGLTGPRHPVEALPGLAEVLGPADPDEPLARAPFDRAAFAAWCAGFGEGRYNAAPLGRKVALADPPALAERLVAALCPLSDRWPLPYAELKR